MLADRYLFDPAQKWLLEAVAAGQSSWAQYGAFEVILCECVQLLAQEGYNIRTNFSTFDASESRKPEEWDKMKADLAAEYGHGVKDW